MLPGGVRRPIQVDFGAGLCADRRGGPGGGARGVQGEGPKGASGGGLGDPAGQRSVPHLRRLPRKDPRAPVPVRPLPGFAVCLRCSGDPRRMQAMKAAEEETQSFFWSGREHRGDHVFHIEWDPEEALRRATSGAGRLLRTMFRW